MNTFQRAGMTRGDVGATRGDGGLGGRRVPPLRLEAAGQSGEASYRSGGLTVAVAACTSPGADGGGSPGHAGAPRRGREAPSRYARGSVAVGRWTYTSPTV